MDTFDFNLLSMSTSTAEAMDTFAFNLLSMSTSTTGATVGPSQPRRERSMESIMDEIRLLKLINERREELDERRDEEIRLLRQLNESHKEQHK